ncbi:glycosyltransferase family 2 protein [Streptoverticillium reticulum]|uniref:glycosyltransferase family 2 protein n=1 Tax=Streptoverticillium reticulum TaxID=1433415 RepID=UPI0039BF3160
MFPSVPPADVAHESETVPDVSVVMAVFNAMPYLTECLQSIVTQTLGMECIEVIAVNDGSTDGSGAELDRYAALHPQIHVIHQANSGGPSQPRNRALDLARGRYTFVVDADDYLGPEAFQRLVAMADTQHSDIVLAKHVGVNRPVSVKAYQHAEHVDLFTSEVYRTLNSIKLIRRELLERERIRFPEDLWLGEDQLFMTQAYLAAGTISVVGDYDCYFACRRDGGTPLTSRPKTPGERIAHIERVMRLVADRVEDPVGRRRMLARHFRALVDKVVVPVVRSPRFEGAYRQETLERAMAVCRQWWDEDMAGELSAPARVTLHCFLQDKTDMLEVLARHDARREAPEKAVIGGRVYLRLPGFKDETAGIPDELFDVTHTLQVVHRLDRMAWRGTRVHLAGHAYIEGLMSGYRGTELVLRERGTRLEHHVPVELQATPHLASGPHPDADGLDRGTAGFAVEVDLRTVAGGGPVTAGTWDVLLRVHAQGVSRRVRIGSARSASFDATARRPLIIAPAGRGAKTALVATVFFTRPHGNLSLEVARRLPLPSAPAEPAERHPRRWPARLAPRRRRTAGRG